MDEVIRNMKIPIRTSVVTLALGVSLIVSACDTIGDADLFGVAPPEVPEVNTGASDQIDDTIRRATDLRREYQKRYRAEIATLPYYNFPLIGAAMTAIGGLLFSSHQDLVAAAGLAGGGTLAVRSAFSPSEVGAAYITGAAALDCIVSNAAPLKQDHRQQTLTALDGLKASVRTQTNVLQDKLTALQVAESTGRVNPSLTGMMARSRGSAEATLQAATKAMAALKTQIDTLKSAANEIQQAFGTVHAMTAKRIAKLRTVSFVELQGTITSAIASVGEQTAAVAAARGALSGAQPASQASMAAGPQGQGYIDDVNTAAMDLKDAVQELLDHMPDFIGAIARVKLCTASG